jgi:putative addiction module component (TIGR02574 family)
MAKVTLNDLLELSIPERLVIVEDLWDSLAATPTSLPVTEEQQRELDNRLREYEAEPQAGQSWARAREDILSELSEPPNEK